MSQNPAKSSNSVARKNSRPSPTVSSDVIRDAETDTAVEAEIIDATIVPIESSTAVPFRLYRFLTPLVAAIQWTGDNDIAIDNFGAVMTANSGIVFGFDHKPLQPTAMVFVAAHGKWLRIERGSWLLFSEDSGFFTLADETFQRQFREETDL